MPNCKNCQKEFTISDVDREFYNKMEVPEPTHCPHCRQLRRLVWRNERNLFYRTCSLTGEKILADIPESSPLIIYPNEYWFGDDWQAPAFDYNPARPFLEQWRELQLISPRMALYVQKDTTVNSDYTNCASYLKNCYMAFSSNYNEDLYYSVFCYYSNSSVDCLNVHNSEMCYQSVDCDKCFNLFYSDNSQNCSDCMFVSDCVGCRNCFGCTNLRNQEYYFWNKKLTPEDYKKEMAQIDLGDYQAREKMKKQWQKFKQDNLIGRYYHGVKNQDVIGNYLDNCKNAKYCFDCRELEDCKYCTRIVTSKDCYDHDHWGFDSSLTYEVSSSGYRLYNIKFCALIWESCRNLEYCSYCFSCSDCFGCCGLKKAKYCILNKQYDKKEYHKLVKKIKESMRADGSYGEFFPAKYSPYAYNHSYAVDCFDYSQEEVEKMGIPWQEEEREYQPANYQVPDHIKEVKDDIFQAVLACEKCQKNYKLIKQELEWYQKNNIPVPRQCFTCRHLARNRGRNPRLLTHRQCMKEGCTNEFETTYALDRPEKVYCEECYQKEIY